MAAALSMPVFMRVGDGLPEVEIGRIEIPASGEGAMTLSGADVAQLLRAAADSFERADHALDDEEVPDDAAAC